VAFDPNGQALKWSATREGGSAAFIFQVPEVPSRPCAKQVAESSVDTSKTRMAS
jgi:hypothetical protein